MKKLMQHQEIGVSLMVQHAIGFANHSDPGTGKTLMAISAADRIGVDKVLVVCPRTLKINWSIEWKDGVQQEWNIVVVSGTKARRNKQIEQACKSNQATVLITHYDTLEKDVPQLVQFKPELVIADECFTKDTLVKTPNGYRYIDHIKIGDEVCNASGVGIVKNVFKSTAHRMVSIFTENGVIHCTRNHPFFTNKGWVLACNLNDNHFIKTHDQTMRILQEEFLSNYKQESFLRHVLLSEMEDAATGNQSKNFYPRAKQEVRRRSQADDVGESRISQKNSAIEFAQNEGKESDVDTCNTRQGNGNSQAYWTQTQDSWRQRNRTNESRTSIVGAFRRLLLELSSIYKRARQRISESLQNRHRISIDQTCNRGRWEQSQFTDSTTTGSQKRGQTQGIRVVGVTCTEFPSNKSDDGSDRGIEVYNLEVTNHPSYVVTRQDLVVHNCHLIKNHRSHRAKALKKIPTKYKFGLTGTPQTNSPLDHYSQFDWLRPGYLGVNFYVFRAIYADVYTGGGYPLIKSYRRIDELKAKIAKYAYRARKDECLDLPDKMFQTILIDLEPSARKIYDTLAEEFIADVFHDGEQHEVLADTVLVRLLRFQQLTSGFIGIEGPPKTVKPIGDEKLEALIELAETMDREKIVVWTKFNYDMQRVSAALAETGRKVHRIAGDVSEEDRNKAVQEFQQDNNRNDAIVCNIQVGGTGLTLTAARYAIYYSRNFSLGDDIQSQDRIHRIGQTRKVTYYDLVCRNTIDEHIIKLLRKKKELAARINGDDVRRILRGES